MTDQTRPTDPRPPMREDPDLDARLSVDRGRTARGTDAPDAPDAEQEPNPLLREGADAPDAADIEDPSRQR